RDREQEERAHDLPLRSPARSGEAAGNPTEQSACAVGADEQACAGLREVELLGVRRDERGERREEERVDEDDRADEGEQTAHAASLAAHEKCTEPVAPSSDFPT